MDGICERIGINHYTPWSFLSYDLSTSNCNVHTGTFEIHFLSLLSVFWLFTQNSNASRNGPPCSILTNCLNLILILIFSSWHKYQHCFPFHDKKLQEKFQWNIQRVNSLWGIGCLWSVFWTDINIRVFENCIKELQHNLNRSKSSAVTNIIHAYFTWLHFIHLHY